MSNLWFLQQVGEHGRNTTKCENDQTFTIIAIDMIIGQVKRLEFEIYRCFICYIFGLGMGTSIWPYAQCMYHQANATQTGHERKSFILTS